MHLMYKFKFVLHGRINVTKKRTECAGSLTSNLPFRAGFPRASMQHKSKVTEASAKI